jgi:hypothetical protein
MGVVIAFHRGDDAALRALRPESGTLPNFVPEAFSTIALLANLLGQTQGADDAAVLQHIAREAEDPLQRRVGEIALAGLRGDPEFKQLVDSAISDAEFAPTVIGIMLWEAEQIAQATGSTTDEILQHLAMTAAVGEAGLVSEPPETPGA